MKSAPDILQINIAGVQALYSIFVTLFGWQKIQWKIKWVIHQGKTEIADSSRF